MQEEERARIGSEIRKRIKETELSISRLEEQAKPVAPDRSLGRITRMDAINQKHVSEANLRAAKELLKNLTDALNGLDDEQFGICRSCKSTMPIERILAVPNAKLCVPCIESLNPKRD